MNRNETRANGNRAFLQIKKTILNINDTSCDCIVTVFDIWMRVPVMIDMYVFSLTVYISISRAEHTFVLFL